MMKIEVLKEINNYLKDKKITSENVVEIIKYFQTQNPSSGSFVHWQVMTWKNTPYIKTKYIGTS